MYSINDIVPELVKGMDLKSIGHCPREFESRRCRSV